MRHIDTMFKRVYCYAVHLRSSEIFSSSLGSMLLLTQIHFAILSILSKFSGKSAPLNSYDENQGLLHPGSHHFFMILGSTRTPWSLSRRRSFLCWLFVPVKLLVPLRMVPPVIREFITPMTDYIVHIYLPKTRVK